MAASTTAPSEAQHTNAHIDPAAQVADAGFVPVQTRSERPHSFDPDDFGTPTGREVNWKHTPVVALTPLFRTAEGRTGRLTDQAMSQPDVYRMIGRRAEAAGQRQDGNQSW